ncbi:MAG TPA: hypothetical protein VNT51_13510 [Miltoncostaeaceae bacterium]|jgi:hypothetical protein|nr:hypothetical protein [Miltoncostaeaceae bacterium]
MGTGGHDARDLPGAFPGGAPVGDTPEREREETSPLDGVLEDVADAEREALRRDPRTDV